MTTAIIYWTGTGHTEAMAEAIAAGLRDNGAEAEVITVDKADAGILERYDRFAFGCPSMGDEVLEEGDFEPFFASIEGSLAGKKVALFGSYGWGGGEAQLAGTHQERGREPVCGRTDPTGKPG